MAEAIAVIGFLASLVELIRLGGAVVSRVVEYQSTGRTLPKAFRSVESEMPLVLDALNKINLAAESKAVDQETLRVLKPVLRNCHETVGSISGIVTKAAPLGEGTYVERGFKAISSLRLEKEMEKEMAILKKQLALLSFHAAACLYPSEAPAAAEKNLVLLPFARDKNFIDRPEVMARLNRVLKDEDLAVVTGLGGIGKTQLAIEHCYRYLEKHPAANVFWIPANSLARVFQGWSDVAKGLEIPGCEDPDNSYFELVQHHLTKTSSREWLMVLDNTDDEKIMFEQLTVSPGVSSKNLFEYLPRNKNGRVIVTTRDRRLGEKLVGRESLISVALLSDEEAIKMLERNVNSMSKEHNDAVDLVAELGNLPLAITQASAFISQNNITVKEYLASLRADDFEMKELLDQDHYDVRRDCETQTPVLRTWKMSFQLIQKRNPRAIEILSLMAVFDRQGIPKSLLQKDGETRVSLNLALGLLQGFSLITQSGESFSMHRLVSLATEAWLETDGHKWGNVRADAIAILASKFPETYSNIVECDALIPHVFAVTRYDTSSDASKLLLASLVERVAAYYGARGRTGNQLGMLSRAMKMREEVNGKDSEDVLECLACIGNAEEDRGNYGVAEATHQKVYEARLKSLGRDHRLTLRSLVSVGGALWLQGKFAAAKDVLEQASTAMNKSLGPSDSETLDCLQDLAVTYDELGDLLAAERMHRKNLDLEIKAEGQSSSAVAATLGNLASCLNRQGKNEAATELWLEAWEIRKRSLGDRNPITITSLGFYAGALWHEGKYEEAERRQREALTLRNETLPQDHPDILQNIHDLAECLIRLGRHQEAEDLLNHVIQVRSANFGPDHPRTMDSMNVLAHNASLQGRHLVCEQTLLRLLAMRLQKLGPHHPATLHNMDEIAGSLWAQQKFAAALEMQQRVLAERKLAQGPSHPETLASMDSVVGSMWGQNRLAEATVVLREALKLWEERYGEKDLETLTRMTRLAYLVRIQGEKDEAIGLYERALTLYKEVLGSDDLTTKDCAQCVVDTLAEKMENV